MTCRCARRSCGTMDARFGEAEHLNAAHPDLAAVLGVPATPGFTAPKLLWMSRHEPKLFAATRHVLLPKDYVRLFLTGEHVTDMSDAAGRWWLDEAKRDWCGCRPEGDRHGARHGAETRRGRRRTTEVRAVDDIGFEIEHGEVVGFLGPKAPARRPA